MASPHFAHIGGAAAGLLTVFLMRPKRDSEEYASAQAMRSDVRGHLMALSLPELESLLEGTDDPAVVIAFCRKAQNNPLMQGHSLSAEALRRHATLLLEKGDPEDVAQVVLMMPETVAPMPTGWLLRLASKLEIAGAYQFAADIYRRMTQTALPPSDLEMILLRLARLLEQSGDKRGAANAYAELLKRVPNGPASANAHAALARLTAAGITPTVPVAPATGQPSPSPGGLAPVLPRQTPALSPPNADPNYRAGTPTDATGASLLSPIGAPRQAEGD